MYWAITQVYLGFSLVFQSPEESFKEAFNTCSSSVQLTPEAIPIIGDG